MRAQLLVGVCVVAFVATPIGLRGQSSLGLPGDRRLPPLTTPRVTPLPLNSVSPAWDLVLSKYSGEVHFDNGFRTLLRFPQLAEAMCAFTKYLTDQSTLSPRHREILVLRVAWLTGSNAIWAGHAAHARTVGMTASDIRRVAEGPSAAGLDSFEATLLRFTDELYRNSAVTDATWKTLAATYDIPHLMDAVGTVTHFTMLAWLSNSLGVQPDEGTTDRLPTDVPYRVNVAKREAVPELRFPPVPGTGLLLGRTFAMHPTFNEAHARRGTFPLSLSERQKELVTLRAYWDQRSEWGWAKHGESEIHSAARDVGLGVAPAPAARPNGSEVLRRIAEGPDAAGWDPDDGAILRAVDELYHDDMISDVTWRALDKRFGTLWLVGLIHRAGNYRTDGIWENTWGMRVEPGEARLPQLSSR